MEHQYECPWCGEPFSIEYNLHLHIEQHHVEDSPFAITDGEQVQKQISDAILSRTNFQPYDASEHLKCTRPGCGKSISLDKIDEHLSEHESKDMQGHMATELNKRQKTAQSNCNKPSTSKQYTLLDFFSGNLAQRRARQIPLRERAPRGRLGLKELGPYAFEKSMPTSVRQTLERAARPVIENHIGRSGSLVEVIHYPNETEGLIPVLADICALDDSVTTYLCHPSTKHIHRIQCDGNFCGYWSIQMLLSYVLATTDPHRGLPTVLQIQEMIEKAWDAGTCAFGRDETGGILNTRKWIGTNEAVAFFRHLDIPVSAASFQQDKVSGSTAHASLIDLVEAYFLSGTNIEKQGGSNITQLPPIFLQRAGHSMVIVGLEKNEKGERSLLIFDSSHATTDAMLRLIDGRSARGLPDGLLSCYRKQEYKLAIWDEYETMMYARCIISSSVANKS